MGIAKTHLYWVDAKASRGTQAIVLILSYGG